MARLDDTYKHYLPDLGLSIERNTSNVPQDGKYYLVRNGQIVKGFRALKSAEIAFREVVAESGYKPKPIETQKKSAAEENIERYVEAKDLYWSESHKFRGGGGKGGRGGV